MSEISLPSTYRALQFTSSTSPPNVVSLPTPALAAGSVLIQPLRTSVVSYIADIFSRGNPRGYNFPLPIVPGSSTVGRVIAAASDLASLKPGALVWVDPVLRARDGSTKILHGLNGPPSAAATALMEGEWRNGSWAELVRVPGENVHILDEKTLLGAPADGGMGYGLDDLGYISTLLVAYGGLRDVNVLPGEIVLVAPSTGSFGGAAVHVALALGASVIALGRNTEVLERLKAAADVSYPSSKLVTVQMTPELDQDGLKSAIAAAATSMGSRDGAIDVYFDISPPKASASLHINAGILSLRPGGRVSLMGGAAGDVGIPYFQIMLRGLRLQGTFMYTIGQVDEMIRLIETGKLKLGERYSGAKCVGRFGLEDWEEAFLVAEKEGGAGRFVLLAPNGKEEN